MFILETPLLFWPKFGFLSSGSLEGDGDELTDSNNVIKRSSLLCDRWVFLMSPLVKCLIRAFSFISLIRLASSISSYVCFRILVIPLLRIYSTLSIFTLLIYFSCKIYTCSVFSCSHFFTFIFDCAIMKIK